MFGGSKNNTFGQPSATPAFSSFNQQQPATGFGQSAFAKPAGGFGTSFGQQNNSVFGAQPAAGTSLFGATNPPQQQGFGSKFLMRKPRSKHVFSKTKFLSFVYIIFNFATFCNRSLRSATATTTTDFNFWGN